VSIEAVARGGAESPDPRFIALGAARTAADVGVGLASAGGRLMGVATGPLRAALRPLAPSSVDRRIVAALVELDRYGRQTASAASRQATDIVATLAEEITRDPAVLQVIEEVVEHIRWSVVDAVLPAVLERLTADPDPVRALVRGQSRGAAEEITNTARARAEQGDQAVEAFLGRLLHRRRRARPAGTPLPVTPPAPLAPATVPLA
jgi:hypothetical protein